MLRLVLIDNGSYRTRIQDLIDVVEVAQAFKRESLAKKWDDIFASAVLAQIEPEHLEILRDWVDKHKENSVQNISTTVAASAVVLSHTHLDYSLNRLLAVSVQSDWKSWADQVLKEDKARYSLAEVLRFDQEKERNRAACAFLKRLEHKSIPDRNALLLTKVGRYALQSENPRMSNDALKAFDGGRHGVIHQNHLTRTDFADIAPKDFLAVFKHIENLVESVCEACAFDWENLNLLDPEEPS